MSGGRFLVSAKDVSISENILKVKTLVREVVNIDESLKINNDFSDNHEKLLYEVELSINDECAFELDKNSSDISDYVAG